MDFKLTAVSLFDPKDKPKTLKKRFHGLVNSTV